MSERGKVINEMAAGYLAANGFAEYDTDQEDNFWLGHFATFGMRVADAVLEEAARVAESCFTTGRTAFSAIRALKATPTTLPPSERAEGERVGAARERAAVVAWLRGYVGPGTLILRNVATHIERGDHIPAAPPEQVTGPTKPEEGEHG